LRCLLLNRHGIVAAPERLRARCERPGPAANCT
jgi:hypothetical protein